MLDWARELLDSMQGLCEMLDHGEPARPYATALEQQRAKIDDVERTPSARLLARNASERRIVRAAGAAHVENAQGLFS